MLCAEDTQIPFETDEMGLEMRSLAWNAQWVAANLFSCTVSSARSSLLVGVGDKESCTAEESEAAAGCCREDNKPPEPERREQTFICAATFWAKKSTLIG